MDVIKNKLEQKFNIPVLIDEPMCKRTSLRVGGPADYFVIAKTMSYLEGLYKYAKDIGLPIFILGSGTNVLVGDKGIRGLVIKNEAYGVRVTGKINSPLKKTGRARRQETHWRKGFLTTSDLYYEENVNNFAGVEVLSGTVLSMLIKMTLDNKICGLQWFAGIPGTVGGAIWNNIHGAHSFFGDFMQEVVFVDGHLNTQVMSKDELKLKYNESFFQDNSKLILSSKLTLPLGDYKKAKMVSAEWAKRKIIQPKNSAGCTFSNLSENERERLGLENCGSGFIIDKILNLRGLSVGGAKVSEDHANFIETNSNARAKDVLEIIEHINNKCYQKLGINLQEEIVRIGEF